MCTTRFFFVAALALAAFGCGRSYKSTVNDGAPEDLRMDGFMVSLVYGWHPIIEGMKRLKSGE